MAQIVRYNPQMREVVLELREALKGQRSADAKMVRGIERQCKDTGNISLGQMRVLGFIYKRTVQNGRYVHHNWAIWA